MAAKRVRMTAQQRREQLIGVARSLFAAKGFSATSIEEIAEHAGVSKPIVYQHFGGKEGLYAVVVDREVRYLTTSIMASFDAPTPRLIAEQAADAFLGYIEEHEEGFRVLIRDAPIGMTGGSFASVISDVALRTEQALVDEFDLRGFDVSTAPMYGLMLVGAVAFVGEWWLDHRSMPREQVAAHVVNLLYNGLHHLEARPVARSLRRRATTEGSTPSGAERAPQSAGPQSAGPQSAGPQSAADQSAGSQSAKDQSAGSQSAADQSAGPQSAEDQPAGAQPAAPASRQEDETA